MMAVIFVLVLVALVILCSVIAPLRVEVVLVSVDVFFHTVCGVYFWFLFS